MKKYKAIILDLDGTVVPSRRDGMPSEKVKNAVMKAKKQAIVSVATGRPTYLSDHIFKVLELSDPCVVDGGAEIVDLSSGKLLFKKYLSLDKQKAIFRICQRFGIPIYTSENEYDKTVTNIDQLKAEVAKFFIDSIPPKTAIALLEEFESIDGIAPHLATSWRDGDVTDIHITDELATKKHGIEELLRILNLKPEEVIGVGDGHNDLPMLEAVGLKVVMGNAPKEVKAVADYLAPSLAEDGVADVIEKFILVP
jgi:HAD superfamily hydrolase (TIGR01484 family)